MLLRKSISRCTFSAGMSRAIVEILCLNLLSAIFIIGRAFQFQRRLRFGGTQFSFAFGSNSMKIWKGTTSSDEATTLSLFILKLTRSSAYTILPPIVLYTDIHRTPRCSVRRTLSFCLQFGNSDNWPLVTIFSSGFSPIVS